MHYVQLQEKEEALFFIAVRLSRKKKEKSFYEEFHVKTNDEFYCKRSNILELYNPQYMYLVFSRFNQK